MRLSKYVMFIVAFLFPLTTLSGVAVSAPWVGFEDVPPSNMFYDDIAWLAQEGITRGCNPPANTKFCPDDRVSRGQMAAFLTRALELPEPAVEDWFEDDDESIFENDIDRLAAAGVTAGCNPPANTHFCPDVPVTRAQMASFLVRALELEAGAGIDWFNDDDESVHQANIDRLRAAWITFGCNPPTEDNFCPNRNVTRQQMAAFLHRALTQTQPGAAIGVHGSTWPDPIYLYADIVGTFEVRNTGSLPLSNVSFGPYQPEGEPYPWGDCRSEHISGPQERLGDGDDLLDPGEIWDWYCGMPAVWDWGAMYVEVRALADPRVDVTSWTELRYSVEDPIALAATSSATSVTAGEEVTWKITLRNRSTVRCVSVQVEARLNGTGPYTDYRTPQLEVAGNGDDVMDPGEVWQYQHTEQLWADAYLQLGGSYAPDFMPGAFTGIQYLDTDVVKVVESD